jgi:hypothetical protein
MSPVPLAAAVAGLSETRLAFAFTVAPPGPVAVLQAANNAALLTKDTKRKKSIYFGRRPFPTEVVDAQEITVLMKTSTISLTIALAHGG